MDGWMGGWNPRRYMYASAPGEGHRHCTSKLRIILCLCFEKTSLYSKK